MSGGRNDHKVIQELDLQVCNHPMAIVLVDDVSVITFSDNIQKYSYHKDVYMVVVHKCQNILRLPESCSHEAEVQFHLVLRIVYNHRLLSASPVRLFLIQRITYNHWPVSASSVHVSHSADCVQPLAGISEYWPVPASIVSLLLIQRIAYDHFGWYQQVLCICFSFSITRMCLANMKRAPTCSRICIYSDERR